MRFTSFEEQAGLPMPCVLAASRIELDGAFCHVRPSEEDMMTGKFQREEDQLAVREPAQRLSAGNSTPDAATWDADYVLPMKTVRQSADVGFGGIVVCGASGGIGLNRLRRL